MAKYSTLFLGCIFFSTFGSIVALLGSTTISTEVGSGAGAGATYTGILLAVYFAPAIIAEPYSTWLAGRFGTRKFFVIGQSLVVILNLSLAGALLLGAPAYLTLLLFSGCLGAIGSMLNTLVPVIMKSYLPSATMAGSLSKSAVANGLASVFGALFATFLLAQLAPAAAFVVNSVLTIPYILFILFKRPQDPIASPTNVHRTWRTLFTTLKTNRRVLRAGILWVGALMLIGPLNSMVVPLTHDLGITLTSNAGHLLAVLAAGQMLSPLSVRWLSRRFSALYGGAFAIAIAGSMLAFMGIILWLVKPEWLMFTGIVVAALVFGSMRIAGRNLVLNEVSTSIRTNETTQGDITAFTFLGTLAAPFAPLIWGIFIDGFSASSTLVLLGVLTLVFVSVHVSLDRRAHIDGAPLITRP